MKASLWITDYGIMTSKKKGWKAQREAVERETKSSVTGQTQDPCLPLSDGIRDCYTLLFQLHPRSCRGQPCDKQKNKQVNWLFLRWELGFPGGSVVKNPAEWLSTHTQAGNWWVWPNIILLSPLKRVRGFPGGSAGKESACNMEDLDLISELGRSLGEGKGYPFQYSGLENPKDSIVHGVSKSRTRLNNFHFQKNYRN